jgi:hypothetical protein
MVLPLKLLLTCTEVADASNRRRNDAAKDDVVNLIVQLVNWSRFKAAN